MGSPRASRLRQHLAELTHQYQEAVQRLLEERGPLIRGSFGTRARQCGNPSCHCAEGERHPSKYLTATDGGKVRQVHVPAGEETEVANGVARYRRFRMTRGRLSRMGRKLVELIDELGRSLLKAYPPGHPLPPASKRGRRRSKGAHRAAS